MMKMFLSLSFILTTQVAFARVFDIKKEFFAPYLKGTYGPSNLKQTAFDKTGGTDVNWDQSVARITGGEVGFVFAFHGAAFRLGVEALAPQSFESIAATDAAGTPLYSLKSEIGGVFPKATLEMVFWESNKSRFFIAGSGGKSTVTVQNTYTMTSAGQTQLGVSDYLEKVVGYGFSNDASFNFETNMSDTTTIWFEAGYRNMVVTNFQHKVNATTINGVVHENDNALNADGSNRNLDLSGYYAGLGFRLFVAF